MSAGDAIPPEVLALKVSDLEVSYRLRSGLVRAVRGVDLCVHPGRVLAVVGESGSGKSTLAHAIVGLLPRGGRIESGRILLAGRDISALDEKEMRSVRGRLLGLIPQDPTVSLNPVKRVGEQVAESLRVHGLADKYTAARRAVEMLQRAGLSDPATRAVQYPHELSGGMCQRVLIAAAFACEPGLVIADEPTSALDVTVQRQILDHIERMTRESGTSVLLITHDLGVAADRADDVVVMSQGCVVEAGPARQVLEQPEHEYTRRLMASAPSLASQRLVAAWASGPGATGRPIAKEKAKDALVTVHGLVKEFPLPGPRRDRRTLTAVDGVSFRIRRAETFSLVGESGSGKSTIARIVAGLTPPTGGRVVFEGVDVTDIRGAELRAMRRSVQLIYQNPYASLDPRFNIAQTIEEPLRSFRMENRKSRGVRVAELLDLVALPSSFLQRRPAELSGGQRQRVAIARAIALDPDLVICDEPVSALDVSVQAQILELLVRLQSDLALSYLFISHDLAVVRQVSHQVGVMKDGRLLESGTADDVFTKPQSLYTEQLLAAIPGGRYSVAG